MAPLEVASNGWDSSTKASDVQLIDKLISEGSSPCQGCLRMGCRVVMPIFRAIDVSAEVLQILLKTGADPDEIFLSEHHAARRFGTPLQKVITLAALRYARPDREEMVGCLLESGANPNLPTARTPIVEGDLPKNVCRTCLDTYNYQKDSCRKCMGDATPSQIAGHSGLETIAKMLIERGAHVNTPAAENAGAAAVQYACMNGFFSIVLLLLDNKAEINAPGAKNNGRTALEGAAEHGRLDIVQLLLNKGAATHGNGQVQYERALTYALSNGHHAFGDLLEKHYNSRVV